MTKDRASTALLNPADTILDSTGTDFSPPPTLARLWSSQFSRSLRQGTDWSERRSEPQSERRGKRSAASPDASCAPPRWAFRCEAAKASNVEAHLLEGVPLERQRGGLARCRHVLCPYCHREVMAGRRLELVGRFETAIDDGVAFAHVTLTTRSVPLGDLEQQRETILAAAESAFRCVRRQSLRGQRCDLPDALLGHLNADHNVLTAAKKWHLHRHVVLAAPTLDAALGAAFQLAKTFNRSQKQGGALTQLLPYTDAAPDPIGFVRYLTQPWVVAPSTEGADPKGSLTPMGLAARALAGDHDCHVAFLEVTQAIARRPLFRGSGVLGARCNLRHQQ